MGLADILDRAERKKEAKKVVQKPPTSGEADFQHDGDLEKKGGLPEPAMSNFMSEIKGMFNEIMKTIKDGGITGLATKGIIENAKAKNLDPTKALIVVQHKTLEQLGVAALPSIDDEVNLRGELNMELKRRFEGREIVATATKQK